LETKMPSKSKAQHNLMAMVAHDPAAAKRLGIPQKVGKDFTKADTGRKFKEGGLMAKSEKDITKAKMGAVKAGGNKKFGEHAVQTKGHTKGMEVSMKGGKPLGMKKGGMK
jgi:hypothetical protein